jgi:hypothetical protein
VNIAILRDVLYHGYYSSIASLQNAPYGSRRIGGLASIRSLEPCQRCLLVCGCTHHPRARQCVTTRGSSSYYHMVLAPSRTRPGTGKPTLNVTPVVKTSENGYLVYQWLIQELRSLDVDEFWHNRSESTRSRGRSKIERAFMKVFEEQKHRYRRVAAYQPLTSCHTERIPMNSGASTSWDSASMLQEVNRSEQESRTITGPDSPVSVISSSTAMQFSKRNGASALVDEQHIFLVQAAVSSFHLTNGRCVEMGLRWPQRLTRTPKRTRYQYSTPPTRRLGWRSSRYLQGCMRT